MITYMWFMEDDNDKVLAKGDGEATLATSALDEIRGEVLNAFDGLHGADALTWSTISITLARQS